MARYRPASGDALDVAPLAGRRVVAGAVVVEAAVGTAPAAPHEQLGVGPHAGRMAAGRQWAVGQSHPAVGLHGRAGALPTTGDKLVGPVDAEQHAHRDESKDNRGCGQNGDETGPRALRRGRRPKARVDERTKRVGRRQPVADLVELAAEAVLEDHASSSPMS